MSTLLEKIWDNHRVTTLSGFESELCDIVYIDLHLIHEVTSPQAFDGLRQQQRKVRRPDLTFATVDHNIPTDDQKNIRDAISKAQIDTLEKNCRDFSIRFFGVGHPHQGIVHVIGPEMGLTHPGATIVCGDSHTSTHGAFGALAFGIGTSEVEHVLATQCLILKKPKSLQVKFLGNLPQATTPKDMIMKLIGQIGTAGATGYVIEYTGPAISALSMEGRMTICNMSIEAGARAGMIAPDAVTFAYLAEPKRDFSPQGKAFDAALANWKALKTDRESDYDHTVSVDISQMAPQVTWGTSPSMVADVTGKIPAIDAVPGQNPEDIDRALQYMGLTPGTAINSIPIDVVFIGSCTNARIEDLRLVAGVLKGKKVSPSTRVMVVPGSRVVQKQAQAEGLDRIFQEAGCEWREPGCSMCLAMNPDQLKPKERAASTSNRNFEGRQGKDGRTHLVSPLTAAATALRGKITDPREIWGH